MSVTVTVGYVCMSLLSESDNTCDKQPVKTPKAVCIMMPNNNTID